MDKNLVFTELLVQGGPNGEAVKTWMLLPFGPSPIRQAMWSPPMQTLICEWTHSFKALTKVDKKGSKGQSKGTEQRMMDKYFMMNISDVQAIQAILDNFVVNYE